MRQACAEAGVALVTGDTKVVDRGKGDRVFITTSGIGLVPEGRSLSIRTARPGDRILVSGTIGDHGIAIMSVREGIEFETVLESDTRPARPIWSQAMLEACPGIRCMRDPTRGGVSSALNELAAASRVGVDARRRRAIPIRAEVPGACEMLGLDPLYVANEGKLIAVVPAEDADRLLAVMRAHPLGRNAAIIGEVVADHPGMVTHAVAGRRRAGRDHAVGRTVAANLLTRSSLHVTTASRRPRAIAGRERRTDHGRSNELPTGERRSGPPAVKEVHVLWITAGLGCDGDSVSITAATQPSIEDVLLGAIPGLPKVHLHNPVLAYENGDEFMKFWYQAAEGRLDPFVLVVEGSIPNEKIKSEGYWAALGTDKQTGQPITTCEWIDRLAPKALAVVAAGTCATYGGIHAMEGNPTGCMGLADYLGWDWKSKAGLPIVNVPGCPVQPDNFMETLLYLLYQAAGLAPMIPLDEQLRPDLALRQDRPRRLRPRRLLRAGRLRPRVRLAQVPREARLLGAGGQLQRRPSAAGWPASAAAPTSAASASAARCPASPTSSCRSWTSRPGAQLSVDGRSASTAGSIRALRELHQHHGQQGTEVAAPRPPS